MSISEGFLYPYEENKIRKDMTANTCEHHVHNYVTMEAKMTCYYQNSYKSIHVCVEYEQMCAAHTCMQKYTLANFYYVCTETTLPYYQTYIVYLNFSN